MTKASINHPLTNWQNDVANGDTLLGYADWYAIQQEDWYATQQKIAEDAD